MHLQEHRHYLKDSLLEKSKLAQNTYEGSHQVGRNEARNIQVENNNKWRKYKGLALISQPSAETFSPT